MSNHHLLSKDSLSEAHLIEELTQKLIHACYYGDSETVEAILAHDLQSRLEIVLGLFNACISGKLPIVKMLIERPREKTRIELRGFNDRALYEACKHDHIDIVSYLLSQDVCSGGHEVVPLNEVAPQLVVIAYHQNHWKMLEYLIFEKEIPLTFATSHFIHDKPELKELFKKRKFYKELKQALPEKEPATGKKKTKL